MKILVAGGEGFIGRYVMTHGFELGYDMWSYDIQSGEDILNREELADTVMDFRPDAIINCAGILGTHELETNLEAAVQANIVGAVNLARVALAFDAKYVGIEQPHIWFNTYEATKLAARRIITGLVYDKDLRADFVTAHNAFGPGQAHGPGHPQKYMPTWATAAWEGKPLPVWGSGNQMINPVWVGHVADVLLQRAFDVEYWSPEFEWDAGGDLLWSVMDFIEDFIEPWAEERGLKALDFNHLDMRSGEQDFPYPEPKGQYRLQTDHVWATLDSYKP